MYLFSRLLLRAEHVAIGTTAVPVIVAGKSETSSSRTLDL
jgi:hypothetical protein